MSEMLGNQYFIARRYSDACCVLEEEYQKNKDNHAVRKRLIICYLKTDQLPKALNHFYSLVNENISFITDTDPIRDDCPCHEIINELTENMKNLSDDEYNITLGILWLYCDVRTSLNYFQKVSSYNKHNGMIEDMINKITSLLSNIN